MVKWKVVFSIEYEVEAENKEMAKEIAEGYLADEFENQHFGLTEIFNCDVYSKTSRWKNSREKKAIGRILDRVERWKMGVAGEYMKNLAIQIDKWLIDDDFREIGSELIK